MRSWKHSDFQAQGKKDGKEDEEEDVPEEIGEEAKETADASDKNSAEDQKEAAKETADNADTQAKTSEDASEAASAEPEPTAAEEVDPNEAARQALPPEAPRLYLTEYEVTLNRGENFSRLSYVQDITDDVDTRERLFRNISIDNDVDVWTAGTYALTYYVMDSNGNRSNDAVLTVTVK